MSKEDILHEIKKLRQWKLDRECLEVESTEWYSRFVNKLNLKKLLPQKDKDVSDYYQTQISWQFAVSDEEGTLLAMIQDKYLEIRHKRNEYETPIGRAVLAADNNPQWRKLTWSPDGTMIAISLSTGEITCYDALGNHVCSIPKIDNNDSNSLIPNGALVSLLLIEKRIRTAEWPYELLALEYSGSLRSYFISPTVGFKQYHTFEFCDTILSSAVYVPLFNIMVVAFPVASLNEKTEEDTLGLSTWRLLNDYPYYRLVKPSIEDLTISKGNSGIMSFLASKNKRIVVVRMVASQSGQYLACVHSCGAVSVWLLPQLKLHHLWREYDLPKYEVQEKFEYIPNDQTINEYFPSDVNWCSNNKLAIIRNNGVLTVSNIENLENLLGQISSLNLAVDRQPQQVYAPAKFANICSIDKGFFVLDSTRKLCNARRDSIFSDSGEDMKQDDPAFSSAIEAAENYSFLKQFFKFFVHFELFQQQKKVQYVERTYNLISLKQVTPEELYSKKINNEEYEEALNFARLFDLDESRVYKKQWEKTPVTPESIENYLMKVNNDWWILNECCLRIPETLSAAKILLNYGLQLTGFDTFISYHDIIEPAADSIRINFEDIFTFSNDSDVKNFTPTQLLILQIRKYLLMCWDTLIIYEKIISLSSKKMSYNENTYRSLRTSSPLSITLNYARDANAVAVEVMLTYHEELLPYWLELLNNIPECIPCAKYRKLLPKLNSHNKLERWKCENIREADWCESGDFVDLLKKVDNYRSNEFVGTSTFPYSEKTVTNWYEDRIRKIADRSGLVDNALELLNYSRTNNIQGLERMEHNLLVLETLMYDLMVEEESSLLRMETSSEIDKLMILMSKCNSEEEFLQNLSNILVPFLKRSETINPGSLDSIVDEYFRRLSKYDLNLPYIFFSQNFTNEEVLALRDKRKLELCLLSIYSCERLDQVNLASQIIDQMPDVAALEKDDADYEELYVLHSKVNELQSELDMMKLLLRYKIEKTVSSLNMYKNSTEFQKSILTEMVNYEVDRINIRGVSKQEIFELLDDMELVQKFFVSLQDKMYLRIFAYNMLIISRSDCIEDYASLVLTCSMLPPKLIQPHRQRVPNNVLSYEESVAIIVDAAQYYYNAASSYEDSYIDLAKTCLSLIQSHPDVDREKKLINALKELSNFGVRISPLKVRTSVDKTKIIEKVLKHKPTAYKKIEKLLILTSSLDTEDENKRALEFKTLNCAVNAAFQQKDFYWCSQIVKQLIENNFSCWEVCIKLCESDEYEDLETKQNLIKFALLQCGEKEIVKLVDLRNSIERKILESKLQSAVQQLNTSREPGSSAEIVVEERQPKLERAQSMISVPLLLNVLQTSSSNMLNVNFWKNTFNFSSITNDGEEEGNKQEVDYGKLGFREFYETIHEHTGCVCTSSGTSEDREVLQLFLRYYLMCSEKSDGLNGASKPGISDVIVQLAIVSYPYDCVFTLGLLLLLSDEFVENVFEALSPTDAVHKFALYYYSLKLISKYGKVTEQVLRKSPSVVILEATTLLNDYDLPLTKQFTKYRNSLEKRRSVNKLQDLGCGIDSARFFNDETYKIDSILGLAMYEERDKLDLALSLGQEYGVSSEDIVLSHIKSLFIVRALPVLTERLKEPMILNILKQNASYTSKRIVADMYDNLYGCDYQVLLLYYALLNQVTENDIFFYLKPKEHMKLLRKLKSFSKNIDYKLLTAESPKIVEALMPAVFSNEITNTINLLVSLPAPLRERINVDDVLEKLTEKTFFNGFASSDCIEKFDMCIPFFEKLPDGKITSVMHNFLFSKYSIENINSTARRKLLNRAIEYFGGKFPSDQSEVVENLKSFIKEFQKVDEFNEICNAVVDVNDSYLSALENAYIQNSTAELQKIMLKMVLDMSICADSIKIILEFLRMKSLMDIITDLLDDGIDKNDAEGLLQRIENCLEDNEYETCWIPSLELLINRDEISENVKIKISKVLSILEQSEEDVYKIIELLHETRLILREWVSVQSAITLFDVSTVGTRLSLLKLLSKQCSTFAQVKHLHKLLQLWPSGSETTDLESNSWAILMERILQLDQKKFDELEELKIVERIFVRCKFTKETGRVFFERISCLPHNEILLVWFCVLTKDELLIQSVTSYITELRALDTMPKIIESYLKQMEKS